MPRTHTACQFAPDRLITSPSFPAPPWHNTAPVTRCAASLHALGTHALQILYIAAQLVHNPVFHSHVAQPPMAMHSSNQKHKQIITRASNSGRRRCSFRCLMRSDTYTFASAETHNSCHFLAPHLRAKPITYAERLHMTLPVVQ